MIRICPKCRDYYADDSLGFCLVDGTPLAGVQPFSENWKEGVRVIEEKDNATRKQRRRLRWRRIFSISMTVLIASMALFVVAVNGFIYLTPERKDEDASDKPLTAATVPGGPSATATPNATAEAVPTPEPRATVTPRPTASPVAATTSGPTPTPTPARTACSDADKSREREAILRRFRDVWRGNIEAERRQVIARMAPAGAANVEASLGGLEYTASFFKACQAGVMTVRYAWRISANVNGTIKVLSVAQEKKFACAKAGGAWLCR